MSKSAPEFRTAYDNSQPYYSELAGSHFEEVSDPSHPSFSRTHQSFKDECDVNVIVNQLDTHGFLDQYRGSVPQFLDLSQVEDYHSAMNAVVHAQTTFDALPADVRKRFGNDPANFVDFFQDPENAAEAIRLGLASPAPSVSSEGAITRKGEETEGAPVGAHDSSSTGDKKGGK